MTGPSDAQLTSVAVERSVKREAGRLRLEVVSLSYNLEGSTYCSSPRKLLETKLSFLPNVRKEALLDAAAILICDCSMTSFVIPERSNICIYLGAFKAL